MAKKRNIPLTEVQKWMQQLLLDPHSMADEASAPTLTNESVDSSLEAVIKSSKRLSARQHLAIYQMSYVARLRDCMAKQFSALEYALGENLFQAFADEYLQQYPSTNYNLITLGEKFASFLEATRPDKNEAVKEDWPDFMIELTRFEYAINIIFEEKGEENYTLASHSTHEEAMQLIPVFYIFNFQFPIRWYYASFVNKQEPELPMPKQSFCVVLRHKYKLFIHDLNFGQFQFLRYLKSGLSIAQAKQQLLTQNGVDPSQLETFWPIWKKQWVEAGFFRDSSLSVILSELG